VPETNKKEPRARFLFIGVHSFVLESSQRYCSRQKGVRDTVHYFQTRRKEIRRAGGVMFCFCVIVPAAL
jgi:hypothetical protein